MVEFGWILTNWRSSLIDFDQTSRIRPNSTFEFVISNSKCRNSNEFERIRPSLLERFQSFLGFAMPCIDSSLWNWWLTYKRTFFDYSLTTHLKMRNRAPIINNHRHVITVCTRTLTLPPIPKMGCVWPMRPDFFPYKDIWVWDPCLKLLNNQSRLNP